MPKKTPSQPIMCHKEDIQYELIFSARKTFSIEVRPHLQIIVRVPFKTSLERAAKEVEDHILWIRKKLDYFQKHPIKPPHNHYVNGEKVLYLGKRYTLKIITAENHSVQLLHDHFEVFCKPPASPQMIKALLDKWYREHCKNIFENLLFQCFPYFTRLGFSMPPLRIRHMKTRWGSLSPEGVVTLNSDLVRAPLACIEYVVFHELCHLKHRGHGKRFYNLLAKVLPDWRERRELLRQIIS